MTTEIAVIDQTAIVAAYKDRGGVLLLLDRLKTEASSEVPDVTTAKGRARIASLAHKVSKTKVLVDDFGKELVSEEKKRLALIDADRKTWRDGCDALRDEIRKPLTDWEEAEERRVQGHKDGIRDLRDMAKTEGMTADEISNRILAVNTIPLGDHWQEFAADAGKAKDETMATLQSSLAARQQYEAEQAELARLRAEAAQREQEERDRKIAEAAAERARIEAEAKAKAERDAAEAKARAEQEAADKARRDAETAQRLAEEAKARAIAEAEAAKLREAEQARLRAEAEERARIQAEEAAKRAEEAQRAAVEAERKRAEQAAKDEAARIAREAAEREANAKHRQAVHADAKTAMLSAGLTEEQAVTLIKLIAKGGVPHVSISY